MTTLAVAPYHQAIAVGSKSFALANRLMSRTAADRAAVLYAWCRRADDAVDLCAPDEAPRAAAQLHDELVRIYAGESMHDPLLAAFATLIADTGIPMHYPQALLDGMSADARGAPIATVDALYEYCYQVAGTVGLMMCHVLGVQSDQSLRRAAHLGIAMQLTNICRDVAEDWQRGRLYIPDTLCVEVGAGTLRQRLGEPLDALPRDAIAHAVQRLLVTADGFYRSGDRGITALPWRAGMAVRAARSIYASIGTQLARRRFDPLQGRAIVSPRRKVVLALGAMLNQFAIAPAMLVSWIFGRRTQQPTFVLRFPDDVLPL